MKKVILNFKMNMDFIQARDYSEALNNVITNNPDVIVCPSFPFLGLYQNPIYALGAQDVSEYVEGSYTSSISAKQLASLNVKYVLISHSERKLFQNETSEILINKIRNTISNGMKVILCFGENAEDRKAGKTEFLIRKKLADIFNKLSKEELNNISIAYEPEWAIGSGRTPTNEEIDQVLSYIKSEVAKQYKIKIETYYGGSVNAYNIDSLMHCRETDGFLVGKSSLDIKEVGDILASTKEKF